MARAPRRGEVRRALESELGPDGCVALQRTLIIQTAQWAARVAPGAVFVAHDPPDSAHELRLLVGPNATLFPQNGEGIAGRLGDAVGRVYARRSGPLLIVWPDLPQFRYEHAQAALDDLRCGCDLVLGPVYDGGFYLVGMRRALAALLSLAEQTWRGSDAVAVGLAIAGQTGLRVGVLRSERALHRPADLRAAIADPMLPGALARILARARGR
jgi:glycosyltransferase A (GT-A) superfamily protein (DUF2064 family)